MREPIAHLVLVPFFFFFYCCFVTRISCEATAVRVGVIGDAKLPVGKISPICIRIAAADFYAAHPNYTTRLIFRTRDSGGDVVAAASAALDLLGNEDVHAIMGPQTSVEASFVADLGTRAQVPTVSFSAVSPFCSPERSRYFVRTASSDASQAPAIAAVVQAFGWLRAVPVYEDSEYGAGLIPFLIDALYEAGTTVPYRSTVPISASDDRISEELYKLKTMQTRVFIVHMSTVLSSRFFSLAGDAGMMGEGYSWIATAGLTSLLESLDPSVVHDSMQGVLGVKPHVPRSKEFQDFRRRFKREFLKENPDSDVPEPGIFGLWAYDTVWALALAAEKIGAENFKLDQPKPVNGSTGILSLGVSKTGGRLLDAILKTEFDGLGGRFRLVGGERNVSAFQVVNIVGEKPREIGFWTARYGLTRILNWKSASAYSATRDGLGPVIWPGEVTALPKGWEMPTSGKKLKIAVPGPVDAGFHAFLNVETNPVTNVTVASGFVIEVFEAAVRQLPYALPFEYVRYVNASGKSAGDYNELVMQVHNQKYDAVVGDTTITANRSRYVDFTLPYTVAGVSMVVAVKDERSNTAWIFLKPLTADLWLVSGAFFVFTGLVVWVLEHRVNEEFRGPPTNQIGTVFYFAFSTLVFAHREKMVSNLSRAVMIIWVFVVLILQSSYTASLTSMLTVQQLRPTATDIKQLKDSKEYVGYLKHSFVKGLLLRLGFDNSTLRPYQSPQEYAKALALGSKNGGVAAIIDEIPYLKVFLKDYCDNYTMTGQPYKTGGFGFVFPKGSPLVADLSRAILNITEGDEMADIERRWFGDQGDCPKQSSPFTSNSLEFRSFWGLFLITGTASILAFIIYWACFFYEHRRALKEIPSENSWRRLRSIAKLYDQKDLTSHTFRKPESKDGSGSGVRDPTAWPNATGSESPFSISNHTYGGDATPSVELMSAHSGTASPLSVSNHHEDRAPSVDHTSSGPGTPTHDDMMTARDG